MIAFHVTVNGERECLAGIDGKGVLTSILTWVSRPESALEHLPESLKQELIGEHIGLTVSGLPSSGPNAGKHNKWTEVKLCVGDRVELVVVESDTYDEPQLCEAPDVKKVQMRSQQERVRILCKEWGWTIEEPNVQAPTNE